MRAGRARAVICGAHRAQSDVRGRAEVGRSGAALRRAARAARTNTLRSIVKAGAKARAGPRWMRMRSKPCTVHSAPSCHHRLVHPQRGRGPRHRRAHARGLGRLRHRDARTPCIGPRQPTPCPAAEPPGSAARRQESDKKPHASWSFYVSWFECDPVSRFPRTAYFLQMPGIFLKHFSDGGGRPPRRGPHGRPHAPCRARSANGSPETRRSPLQPAKTPS
jgi:hypothetical protein